MPIIAPNFKFEASKKAVANFNYKLLSFDNFDLHSVLNSEGVCVTSHMNMNSSISNELRYFSIDTLDGSN